MTDDEGASRMPSALEERILRCDVCGRPFVLAYRRGDVAQSLASSRVTSEWIRCPSAACHHLQPVIVPYEGGVASVAEWLGSANVAPLGPTYREVLESGRRGAARSAEQPRPSGFVTKLVRLLSRLRHRAARGAAEQMDAADEVRAWPAGRGPRS